ncbi:hypothetical protein [Tahibacter soli]|uniref:Uncharacterized protein n=1 Tax=Tahibacter soli TaxID=2983605 RepID=A0A9X3YLL6_9GAMM|nr:hypothetical protein [Tahibacter soli]MDC8013460.1 hypothetical protein [Tahibacter soli]
MRRIAAALVLTLAAAGAAGACSLQLGYQRNETFARYDDAYDAWIAELGARLRNDPDPEISYAGRLFGLRTPSHAPPRPPPPPGARPPPEAPEPAARDLPQPATVLAHWLRFLYCDRPSRCEDGLADWIASEPDNAFVFERALTRERRAGLGDVDRRLRLATRYDDHDAAFRALPAKIAARYDVAPPVPPADYEMPPCETHYGVGFAEVFAYRVSTISDLTASAIRRDASISASTKLHVAELMLAATDTPYAADRAVAIGDAVAVAPADRQRWCREKARLEAVSRTLASRYLFGDDAADERRRRFYAALTTRNAIDAAEAVAREENEPLRDIDDAAVAACIAASSSSVGR